MGDVKKYLTRRWLGDGWYVEQLCARSWDEAETFAKRAGVRLDGEHVMTIPAGVGSWLPSLIIGIRNWWHS